MNARRSGALLLAAGLAACVGPTYQRPKMDIPAAYTGPPQPAAKPPAADWWRGFGAPELDRLIALAEQGSPDVQAAAARVIQADQATRVAGSPLLPTVNGTASQNYQRSGSASSQSFASLNIPGFTTQKGHYTDTRTYSAELSASYEVDFWGKNLDALRSAQASALASRYDQQTVWLTTISSIATTYFQALSFRERLVIAQHNVTDAEQVLAAYRAQLQVGTADALDVSQQEALVDGYRAQLPSLESSYRQQVIALSILVGIPPERLSLGPGRLLDLKIPPVTPGLPADVLRRRPDVANAEAQLIAQNETVRQDIANFFPSLQLTASGGLSSLALSTITGPGTLVASLASQLTQTIFDNGLKSGTLGEAKGRYKELAADYAKAVLQALSDVETALTQASFDARQESLEAEAVRIAQRSADIVRAQLAAGTVNIVNVLNTETTLFNDQDTLAQVRLSRFLASVSLYKALGGGWDSALGNGGLGPQAPAGAPGAEPAGLSSSPAGFLVP
jgi:NodT family efflux transporter outer membrane factor (OMF) lipoprotein